MAKTSIIKHLHSEGKDLDWLASKSGIPIDVLNGIFVEDTHELTQERLNLINIACKTDFQLDLPADSTTTA